MRFAKYVMRVPSGAHAIRAARRRDAALCAPSGARPSSRRAGRSTAVACAPRSVPRLGYVWRGSPPPGQRVRTDSDTPEHRAPSHRCRSAIRLTLSVGSDALLSSPPLTSALSHRLTPQSAVVLTPSSPRKIRAAHRTDTGSTDAARVSRGAAGPPAVTASDGDAADDLRSDLMI